MAGPYTAADLRQQAAALELLKDPDTAAMLRAGADALAILENIRAWRDGLERQVREPPRPAAGDPEP